MGLHLGQRKLLLTEVNFLTNYSDLSKNEFIKKIQLKVDDKKLSVFRATQLMCNFLLKNKF